MTLAEAQTELNELQDQRIDLQRRLETAIEQEDVDINVLTNFRKALDVNGTKQYAARARILRLTKNEHQQDRELAIADRDELEKQLQLAAIAYDKILAACEEARVRYQTISLKLGSLDSRIENDRQAINERQQELARHIASWKTNSLLPAAELSACDL